MSQKCQSVFSLNLITFPLKSTRLRHKRSWSLEPKRSWSFEPRYFVSAKDEQNFTTNALTISAVNQIYLSSLHFCMSERNVSYGLKENFFYIWCTWVYNIRAVWSLPAQLANKMFFNPPPPFPLLPINEKW